MNITLEAVIGLMFAGLGACFAAWSLWELIQAVASKKWARTDGVVVVSDLQRSRDSDGGYMYRPEISYRYEVNGNEFVASRPRFGSSVSVNWSGPAVRITRKYKAGSRVTVFYDPTDPSQSVLEPGVTVLVWVSLVGGLIFTTLGFAFVLSAT